MFSINDLGVSYGARVLFSDATINFGRGSRYGIVGANGSGKSTLLRVISSTEEATTGEVRIPKNARVGVLGQDHFKYDAVPIVDVVMMGVPELWEAMAEKEQMLAAAATDPEGFDVDRYGELEDVVLRFDGYTLESRAAEILEGLNIPAAVHRDPLSTLSGGYKLRVLLAQTLASNPDSLLRDEQTNHLDIISINWLEQFLASYDGCAVIVSHDYRFLNTTCTHIIDVDYQLVTLYKGNYDRFETAKVADRERKEAEIAKREAEIEDHKEFVRRFRSKATKARQAQSKMKQIEKITIERLPESSRRHPTFKIIPTRDTGKEVATVEDISMSFGEKHVLKNVNFTISRGERVAIIGANGIGKSTLLKIMMGELAPSSGSTEWGHAVDPCYFSQDHADIDANSEAGLVDWIWTFCPDRNAGYARAKLAEVLFGQDDVEKKIGALSGGELARLDFARLSIQKPTILVLDEPTNHLDLEGIQSLASGLNNFPNTILFVSHDRWFVSQLATRIIELTPDGIVDFKGSYDEYLAKSAGQDHLDHDAVLGKKKS